MAPPQLPLKIRSKILLFRSLNTILELLPFEELKFSRENESSTPHQLTKGNPHSRYSSFNYSFQFKQADIIFQTT